MAASSPSFWVSSISRITPEDIYIRGYPMQEIIGRLSYPAISFLLVRGCIPTPGEARMMDVILSSILDYALQKSGTVAARAIVSVNPQMTAGLSAAMLGAGPYAVSPEDAGRFITEGVAKWRASGLGMEEHAETLVAELRAAKRRIPGFGHQVFRGVDPRAEKLKNFAQAQGVWGEANEWYAAVHEAFRKATGKHDLVMNDVGMLAGIMGQMGFTPAEMTGLALQSTFPGVIAHISEELQSGVINRIVPDSIAEYDATQRSLDEDLAAAGWPA
ncbi:citryl-CoA lyase [Shinella daejeonensis]|uniref:citryl-CoA lyase n=1 Tax=Shinella daejeonensis TaxID=659017 RepID=UPI0020C7A46F|nr:citryl-CoA lyase [Shinella daejeonensis]MCP8897457.1 citryl-CoA lyase [Shinella daejeonensis]